MMDDEITLHSRLSFDKAHEFLDEYGGEIHPIFDGKEVGSPEQFSATSTRTFSSATKYQTEQFLESMEKHKEFMHELGTDVVDLRAKHSWDDMIKAAEDAQRTYEAVGDVAWRKAGRYISARAEMMLPFTRLIPNESYTSILYGGLRLVFEAISRLDERRASVSKAFFRIPKIILLAEECVRIFSSDAQLYVLAEDVFVAALPAIEGTIKWLKQNPARKPLRALIKGPGYNKNYKEKIQHLDDALTELKERVLVLNNQSLKRTETGIENVQNTLNRTDTHLNDIGAKVDNMADLESVREEARRAISIVLQQKFMTAQWMKARDRTILRLKTQMEEMQRAAVSITPDDLLDIINVTNTVQDDLRHMQKMCLSLDLPQINATRSVVDSEKVHEWIDKDAASVIFVEGSGSLSCLGRATPTTLLSTDIINMSRDAEPAVPIYFFCGMHTSPRDSMQGPLGLIRSLIWQVVRLFPPKLDFISRRYRQQLEGLHLHTLCDCFCKLVRRLPNDTILICVIDGFGFFEKKEWASDCREVINELHSLLEDDDINPIFKLFVTSPVRSRYIKKIFPDQACINIAGEQTAGDRHGPTERDLAMAAARSARPGHGVRRLSTTLRRQQFFREKRERGVNDPWSDSESELMTEEQPETGTASEMDIDIEKIRNSSVRGTTTLES